MDCVEYVDSVFWNRQLYDRWPQVVKLSDRVKVEPYKQVPPIRDLGKDAIGVSGIGTIAAARVVPCGCEDEAFVAVSMYARWMKPHPSTNSSWNVGCSDVSAHRIISDLSAFIGHYSGRGKAKRLIRNDFRQSAMWWIMALTGLGGTVIGILSLLNSNR